MLLDNTLGIYIHWPFCKSKCPYCDFNSHVAEHINHEDWRQGYLRELQYYRDLIGARDIQSVFFGGGTPSLMEPKTAEVILEEIDTLWGLPHGTEITLEANPTSVETEKLKGFKSAGVNRVSLGVQAMNDHDLKALGREHSAVEALTAVKTAGDIFDRYSFDLIYARPDQTVESWRQELTEALKYTNGHLSLYQLTIEQGTAFYTLHQRGDLITPDNEMAGVLYEVTQDIMEQNNMPAYEVSNHARTGDESQHNMIYWRYQDYLGIGPGAHGRLTLDGQKKATRAHRAPGIWMQRVKDNGHGAHPFEDITPAQRGTEMLMMGLRLKDGVNLQDLEQETGLPIDDIVARDALTTLESEGLMVRDDISLKATAHGRQKLDAVLSFLLNNEPCYKHTST